MFGKYDAEDMLKSVDAVKRKTNSVREAASTYKVLKSFLHDRISGRIDVKAATGRKPQLPQDLESTIAEKVKEAAEKGFGISPTILMIRTVTSHTSNSCESVSVLMACNATGKFHAADDRGSGKNCAVSWCMGCKWHTEGHHLDLPGESVDGRHLRTSLV